MQPLSSNFKPLICWLAGTWKPTEGFYPVLVNCPHLVCKEIQKHPEPSTSILFTYNMKIWPSNIKKNKKNKKAEQMPLKDFQACNYFKLKRFVFTNCLRGEMSVLSAVKEKLLCENTNNFSSLSTGLINSSLLKVSHFQGFFLAQKFECECLIMTLK